MQSEIINFFWDLLESLNNIGSLNSESFRDEFYSKLEIFQKMIDDGSDNNNINTTDTKTGFTCLDITINRYNFIVCEENHLFVEELLYFILYQETIRPTIDTIYMSAIVARDAKITEEVLKRCDEDTLKSFNQINFYLTPSIIEVFKGFME